ncbi:hypothetical protein ANCDUO_21159 [Ancylostoma duodenale]|uniref:Ricin B lectin domain-containing protein n=1 Tax=Ancylostoma duodenale TaxID=51022 RepID=A0A0C2BXR5_9BILA|nr:hypothetical protein ANCDUO_21159 [Ancylostoma duodenale]
MLSENGEIRRDETCVDYKGQHVGVSLCHGLKGNQEWRYNHQTGRVFHVVTQKCLEMTAIGQLNTEPCNASNKFQQWRFKEYSEVKAEKYRVVVP